VIINESGRGIAMSKTHIGLPGMLLIALLFADSAQAAEADSSSLPESVRAKLADLKAKQGIDHRGNRSGGKSQQDGDACGSLNVGNVSTAGRLGQPVRKVEVYINGDVVNANNKCH
jgi:hypothetical protein